MEADLEARKVRARIRRKLMHRITRDEALDDSVALAAAWRKVKPFVGKALTDVLREEVK